MVLYLLINCCIKTMQEIKKITVYLIIVLLTGCTYNFPEVDGPSSGTANFSKFITIGNSITAGFANGALYDDGQANSFASIVAGQLAIVTPGNFNQPDINSPIGSIGIATGIPGIPDGTLMGRLKLVNPDDPLLHLLYPEILSTKVISAIKLP